MTMFGIWSVIGEVLERERVRFNSLLCLVLWCVSSRFDTPLLLVFPHIGLTTAQRLSGLHLQSLIQQSNYWKNLNDTTHTVCMLLRWPEYRLGQCFLWVMCIFFLSLFIVGLFKVIGDCFSWRALKLSQRRLMPHTQCAMYWGRPATSGCMSSPLSRPSFLSLSPVESAFLWRVHAVLPSSFAPYAHRCCFVI